jgi:hypothetical protein
MSEISHESLFGKIEKSALDTMKESRRLMQEYLFEKPSIDKLLKNKVDDYIILREIPLPVIIGEKKIYVGTFALETQDIFFTEYTKLIALIAARHAGLELGIKLLANGKSLYPLIIKDMLVRTFIYRLINKTILKKQNYVDPITNKVYKIKKVSLGYFKKHVTIEGVIQILMLAYIYNFDATKRSLNIIMGEMGASQVSEVCLSTWLANLAGLSGNFLKDQSMSLDAYIIDLQKAERERVAESQDPG